MRLSTPVLYELAFAATLLLMAALGAAVVVGLRLLLRRWPSVWFKTAVIHAANLAALLFVFPRLVAYLPLSEYLALLNSTLLSFWLGFLIADSARVARWVSLPPEDRRRTWQPVAIFVLLLLGGMACARGTVRSAEGKDALETARWAAPVLQVLRKRSPEREILEAMGRNFPDDLERLLQSYIAQARTAKRDQSGRVALPKFPYREVTKLLRARRADIARASDAELANLARSLASTVRLIESSSAHCTGVGSEFALEQAYADQSADPASARGLGVMLAAALTAARNGIDRPVARTFSEERTAELYARFADAYPRAAAALESGRTAGPEQCRAIAAQMRWIAELPEEDAAYLLALLYSQGD